MYTHARQEGEVGEHGCTSTPTNLTNCVVQPSGTAQGFYPDTSIQLWSNNLTGSFSNRDNTPSRSCSMNRPTSTKDLRIQITFSQRLETIDDQWFSVLAEGGLALKQTIMRPWLAGHLQWSRYCHTNHQINCDFLLFCDEFYTQRGLNARSFGAVLWGCGIKLCDSFMWFSVRRQGPKIHVRWSKRDVSEWIESRNWS